MRVDRVVLGGRLLARPIDAAEHHKLDILDTEGRSRKNREGTCARQSAFGYA